MKAIGYVRCASENKRTLERQQREIYEYCKARGWSLAAVYGDNGKSGMNLNRPGIAGALDALKEGKGDMLVVTSPDRLSRNIRDLVELNSQLKGTGSELALVYASRKVLDILDQD